MAAYPTVRSRAGVVYYVLPGDLLRGARPVGAFFRIPCPIHNSDHQPSLSIHADGEDVGFGRCFSCGDRVLVEALNPDAVRRLRAGGAGGDRARAGGAAPRPSRPYVPNLTAPTVTRSVSSAPVASTQPAEYQRIELAALLEQAAQLRAWLTHERALAYLEARAIPLDVAQRAGVGYLPPDAQLAGVPAKWRDRLTFPLASPAGAGVIGRSLHLWRPGMDEDAHKQALDARSSDEAYTRAWGRRYEKTNPAGWFGYAEMIAGPASDSASVSSELLICEGTLDALAIAAGLGDMIQVVALAGLAAPVKWLPARVSSVLLALDEDTPKTQARARQIADDLRDAGVRVTRCAPPHDGKGKDWSARWRLASYDGLAPLSAALATLDALDGPEALPARQDALAASQRATDDATGDATAALWSLARVDPVVMLLESHGYALARVSALASVAS